jgi:hypothetical protein
MGTLATAPKIPAGITQAIGTLARQYQELQARHDQTEDVLAQLQKQHAAARAANNLKHAAELAGRITAADTALQGISRDMATVRQRHSRQLRAAELARQPAKALSVRCPQCGDELEPMRAWGSGKGYRSGEYDCAGCDGTFEARWNGGIDPDVTVH